MNLKSAIYSMRLRTLPLSLSGVVCGLFMAVADKNLGRLEMVNWAAVPFLLLTTVGLQILSNLSNELGDYQSGTDGGDREGPMYSLGTGQMTVKDFKSMIKGAVVFCCVMGAAMSWLVFRTLCWQLGAMLALGVAAIWASMHYTLGKHPYGYRGLGDVFVFIFFGLVSVLGGYWVTAGEVVRSGWEVLPAVGIGLFSVGVLNVNNIRDMKSDAGTRVTIPLKIGEKPAKVYQTCLIVGGVLSFAGYTIGANYPFGESWTQGAWWWLYLLLLPLYVLHLAGVWKRTGPKLDPMLPMLVMGTFVLSILFGLGLIL